MAEAPNVSSSPYAVAALNRELRRARFNLRSERAEYEQASRVWEESLPLYEEQIAQLEDAIALLGGEPWEDEA